MAKYLGKALLVILLCNIGCNRIEKKPEPSKKKLPAVEKRASIIFQLKTNKDSIKTFLKSIDSNAVEIIAAINRVDKNAIQQFDTIVIPADYTQKLQQYFPFPFYADALSKIDKIILFSYPAQCFAAYENGLLVRTGPTSMGRKADMTPTGLFYTNWKAEETTSTFNDEWELKWNFNIENKLGVGFHQYAMPGYPASHSCLRLKEKDAMYLYNWAEQWKIKGTDDIVAHGTPVIVFGSYPFGSPRPWLALAGNPNALSISESDLASLVKNDIPDILKKQSERDSTANVAL